MYLLTSFVNRHWFGPFRLTSGRYTHHRILLHNFHLMHSVFWCLYQTPNKYWALDFLKDKFYRELSLLEVICNLLDLWLAPIFFIIFRVHLLQCVPQKLKIFIVWLWMYFDTGLPNIQLFILIRNVFIQTSYSKKGPNSGSLLNFWVAIMVGY